MKAQPTFYVALKHFIYLCFLSGFSPQEKNTFITRKFMEKL